MLIVVAYDVNTMTTAGARRLRKVANLCEKFGVRVQNSVFEVMLDEAQFVTFKHELTKLIDLKLDSVRFYKFGNHYKNKIEVMGKASPVQVDEPLLL